MNLTPARTRILETAARHERGLVEKPYMPGFEGVSWKRSAEAMCAAAYLTPYLHGGYEITDAGRAALTMTLDASPEDGTAERSTEPRETRK